MATNRIHEKQAAALWRYLKTGPGWGRRLIVSKHEGRLWWSDGYLMLPVGPAMELLMADYNLPPEPMVCSVGRTLVRNDGKPSDFTALINKATPKKGMATLRPVEFDGSPLTIADNLTGSTLELWSADGGKTVTHKFNRQLLETVYAGGGTEFRAAKTSGGSWDGPVVRFDASGVLTGLLMPTRVEQDGSLPVAITEAQAA